MDDLLIYIRALLIADTGLLASFQACGQTTVSVVDISGRESASYPRLILDGDDGRGKEFGDSLPPLFLDAELRLEIVTRKDDDCTDALTTARELQARCYKLLYGDEESGIESIAGLTFTGESGTGWNVSRWYQKDARFLNASPLYKRHLTKIAVQLCLQDS